MEKDLISVLTPCYNTGKHIHRLLESVLSQTYPNVEMLIVDDGSTDDTREVISDYIPKFAEKGYRLSCVEQKNQGQSVAINRGLKFVRGEFLTWPDSDDFYLDKEAFAKMVAVLKGRDDVGLVRCLNKYFDEDTLQQIEETDPTEGILAEDQFENCLFHENGFYYCPGEYMTRMSVLDETVPEREIYTEKIAGQNWQLMLPLLYNRKCVTIPEKMYGILVRQNSHAHGMTKTFEESYYKTNGYINTIFATLERIKDIPPSTLAAYKKRIRRQYVPVNFVTSVVFGKKDIAKHLKSELDDLNVHLPWIWILRYHFCQYDWFRTLIAEVGKLTR